MTVHWMWLQMAGRQMLNPKWESKGTLIVDMVALNERCEPPRCTLRLLTLEALAGDFTKWATSGETVFMCKVDVANIF